MKELQKRLKQFEGHHPVDERLDFYEGLAKSLLKEKESAKLRRVLNMILFVRDNIKKNDAKAAAYFMFKLAVAIQTADLSLRGRKRKGHKKDRRWLDISIEKALQKKTRHEQKNALESPQS